MPIRNPSVVYTREYTWFIPGTVSTGAEQGPTYRVTRNCTPVDAQMHAKTGPTGQSLMVDINRGGVSIFTVNPEIDAGATVEDNNHAFAAGALSEGEELTLDVDQVGSVIAGADLTVTLRVRATSE